MFGNHLSEEVVVRFSRNEDVLLVQVKAWNDRGGRKSNIGSQPLESKKVGPFIACKTNVRSDVGKKGGASPGMEGVGDFPAYVGVSVRVVSTISLLDGSYLLQGGAAVRKNDKGGGGASINQD